MFPAEKSINGRNESTDLELTDIEPFEHPVVLMRSTSIESSIITRL